MVNKYIVDYHPSRSQLISRIHTLKRGGGDYGVKKITKINRGIGHKFR